MAFGFPPGSLKIYTGGACNSRSFECLFEPIVNCTIVKGSRLAIMQVDKAPHQVLPAHLTRAECWRVQVPDKWAKSHGVLWYRAGLMAVLWRLSARMEAHVARVSEAIGFSSNAIGMHVRHGDSCSDPRVFTMRRCYALSDYMVQAERMRKLYGVNTIFLATDDEQVCAM